MDDVDRKILAELQRDGRLTLTELADRVRLSVSPCHRRLRALERSGAIAGYHAQLDASVLGLTFEALVFVTMRYADRQTVAAFEEHVADIPNVLQAQRLFGDPDYLLRVVARDLPAYRQLYDERLATLPGVPAARPPLGELRRLRAVERHASSEALEEAEIEATLAAHDEWLAAGCPGARSHEDVMAELLGS